MKDRTPIQDHYLLDSALLSAAPEDDETDLADSGQPDESEPAPSPRGDASDLPGSVAAYIRRHVVCSDHQLILLTLWCFYTWCFDHFRYASYLDVRSPASQSGKSRLLQVLERLCSSPDLMTGADSPTLFCRLIRSGRTLRQIQETGTWPTPHTLLFDECQHPSLLSERRPFLALLNSGVDINSFYSRYSSNYSLFGPKAFAGNVPLPSSLASRCVPIILQRKKPSDEVCPLFPIDQRDEQAVRLRARLEAWALSEPTKVAKRGDAPLPILVPAQQNCVAPLLCVAGYLSDNWLQQAHAATAAIFHVPPCDPGTQMLADTRSAFSSHNYPDFLATRDLLAFLLGMEHRPWAGWNRASGNRLARLLSPFDIFSCNLREGSQVVKGYRREDFNDAWERYLPPLKNEEAPSAAAQS